MDTRSKESGLSIDESMREVDAYALSLDAESARYWKLHRRRFEWIGRFVQRSLEGAAEPAILDIGNSYQTLVVKKLFPYSNLDTMGFFDHRFSAGEGSFHIEMDLNDACFPERWPTSERGGYDLIIFAEVLEHLYTSPEQVLSCLKQLLKPGGVILLQTPNAAALKKRLKLLWGKNPYELIRLDRGNPGHFRELTVRDLRRYAKRCGLEVEQVRMDSDLIDGKRFDRFCDRLSRGLPGSFRGGISMSLRLPL